MMLKPLPKILRFQSDMNQPDSPEILEIRECVAFAGTVAQSDNDIPDELVVRHSISYLRKE